MNTIIVYLAMLLSDVQLYKFCPYKESLCIGDPYQSAATSQVVEMPLPQMGKLSTPPLKCRISPVDV